MHTLKTMAFVLLILVAALVAQDAAGGEKPVEPQDEATTVEPDVAQVLAAKLDPGSGAQPSEIYRLAETLYETGDMTLAGRSFTKLARQTEDQEISELAKARLVEIDAMGEIEIYLALDMEDADIASRALVFLYRKYWHTDVRQDILKAREKLRVRQARERARPGTAQETASERQARMWYIVGEIHERNGKEEQAREAYNVIVLDYSESRFAVQAATRLEYLEIDEENQPAGDSK